MVVVGGESMPNLLFPDQAMGVLPGEAFTKSREILEGSKAGLLSRILAHPRMDPSLWKTNLAALFADTLPQRAIVDMKTTVPSTTQASMDLLCETVPSHPGWKELSACPGGHMFPCSPVMATVRLFYPPPSVSDTYPCPPFPTWDSELCYITGAQCVCSSNPASTDSPSGPPSLLPPTASWISLAK